MNISPTVKTVAAYGIGAAALTAASSYGASTLVAEPRRGPGDPASGLAEFEMYVGLGAAILFPFFAHGALRVDPIGSGRGASASLGVVVGLVAGQLAYQHGAPRVALSDA